MGILYQIAPENTIYMKKAICKSGNILYNVHIKAPGGFVMTGKLKEQLYSLFSFSRTVWKRAKEHEIIYVGGQIAYFFILSVFPFLIFINSLIASFNIPSEAAISFLSPFLPQQIIAFIGHYLEYINSQSSLSLLSFGILLAVFSSSKSVRSLKNAFDRAYGVDNARGFFSQIFFSMLFIFIFAIILIVLITVVAFGNDFIAKTLSDMNIALAFIDLSSLMRWLTTAAVLFISISIIYKFIPSEKVPFRETVPGTIFSICTFMILTWLFSVYVNIVVSEAVVYGSVGAVILAMLWMYFAGILLILGAEINKTIRDMKNTDM